MNNNPLIIHVTPQGRPSDILAIIFRLQPIESGISFLTPGNYSQQLGVMRRPTGYDIEPHLHLPVDRTIQYTKEVLYIKSGIIRADFYDEDMSYLLSHLLHAGDFILLAKGGHGFHVIQETEIVEIKQGPYAGNEDKLRFPAIAESEIIIPDLKSS